MSGTTRYVPHQSLGPLVALTVTLTGMLSLSQSLRFMAPAPGLAAEAG